MTEQEFLTELKKIGICPTSTQLSQLNRYYELLVEWNQKMNLTGITEKEQVYLKHFYDSATLNMVVDLKDQTLCDVGTGAGFPGIVLKILFPNLKITLVDSLNKRVEFLKIVIQELDLKEIEAIHARIEEYASQNREKFDLVTARAVAPLNVLLEYTIPILKVGNPFIAMKANISREIIEAQNACKLLDCEIEKEHSFLLPKENSNRTLVVVKKMKKTNHRYPRKFAEIKKRPL